MVSFLFFFVFFHCYSGHSSVKQIPRKSLNSFRLIRHILKKAKKPPQSYFYLNAGWGEMQAKTAENMEQNGRLKERMAEQNEAGFAQGAGEDS